MLGNPERYAMSLSTNAASPGRWFRVNLWLHRWTSLIATLPFLILCLTGAVLIFHEEVEALLGEVPQGQVLPADHPPAYSASAEAVLTVYPEERILSVGIDPEHHPGVMLVVTANNGETGFERAKVRYADLASAQPVGDPEQGQTVTGFLLELHAQWFLGPVGELIGALIALLVLISVVSGVVVYAPYVKRIAFGVLRRGRGARLLQLDLHNFAGSVVLGWLLVVTFTGFLLGFATLALGLWQMTALAENKARYDALDAVDFRQPPVSLNRIFSIANATAEPGWQVTNVIYPGTEFSTQRHYTVLLTGGQGLEQSLFRVLMVDAASGDVAASPEMPLYFKVILLAEPLHFGNYGGLPLKLLWTACTFMAFFITANGAWLWWDRRRRRGRSASSAPRVSGVQP